VRLEEDAIFVESEKVSLIAVDSAQETNAIPIIKIPIIDNNRIFLSLILIWR
jgi:hypothetical protein